MSVLAKLKAAKPADKAIFGVVAGPRLAGKSSLAGTLPGKTLMLQVAVLESGSESAKALATKNKHALDVVNFNTTDELMSVLVELRQDDTYDNIYVDGLSALTELMTRQPKMIALAKQDPWAMYRALGDDVTNVLLAMKELGYTDKAKRPKNVFVTAALAIKQDKAGNIVDVSIESKGNVAVTQITKLGEVVATVLPPVTQENGTKTGHRLLTKTDGVWPGRIDGVLSEDNPGIIEPADLSKLITLKKGK